MKKRLTHLPKHKREELKEIVSIITETADVEMIILFGSHARGDWVEDVYIEDHIIYEYKSDYDLLLIVKSHGGMFKPVLSRRIESAIDQQRVTRTRVSLIIHNIKEVNKYLRDRQYFFTDIVKEGVLLYDSKKFQLDQPQELSLEERKRTAQEDFRHWFRSASEFFIDFGHAFRRRSYSIAAFYLHQTTERSYAAILLVFTHYKPKEHDLEVLDKQAGNLDPRFLPVFPRFNPEEKRLFELLRSAYVDARYKRSYKITKKELEYLAERVKKLQKLTKEICKERIESYAKIEEPG